MDDDQSFRPLELHQPCSKPLLDLIYTGDCIYIYIMTHALRNYSRVSTRLWNNFFWNNFQGIIFEGGRYTIMHVGI